MEYKSQFWKIKVRPAIIKEFTYPSGRVDDMMAGLHEIRARSQEKEASKELISHQKPRLRGVQLCITGRLMNREEKLL